MEKVLLTPTGLRFPDGLHFDDWEVAGKQVAGIANSAAWCLGDWIVYGQQRYSDRYQSAVRSAGLDYQTLRNYAWVVRKFDLPRRRDKLSFQHHAEVASLSMTDQDIWLDRAEQFTWSRNQLRLALRKSRSVGEESTVRLPRVDVEKESLDRWREAAERSDTEFVSWIVATLDHAARSPADSPHG